MGVFTLLFQRADSFLVLASILDEVLDVWGLPLTLLELPCNIHAPGCMPLLKVVLEHEVLVVIRWVVQCCNELVSCHVVLLFSRFIIILINGRTQFGTLIRF